MAWPPTTHQDVEDAVTALMPRGYLLATFTGNGATQQTLSLYVSGDGVTFTGNRLNPVYSPGVVRDPSILRLGGVWYVAYTTANGASTSFDVASSADLVTWTKIATIDATPIGGVSSVWAPELIVDDNGDVYAFFAVNASTMYRVKATNAALTTWSAPTAMTFVGAPAQIIDATFIKRSNTWYCFYKNETSGGKTIERATSSTLTGTFTVDKTGDWAGWGAGIEGPSIVVKPDGTYRMYVDRYVAGTGLAYTESADLTTWTALTSVKLAPGTQGGTVLRHGTVLRLADADSAASVLAAFTTANRTPPNAQGSPLGLYTGLNQFGLPQIEWADGVNDWSWDMDSSGNFRLMRANVATGLTVSYSGGKITFTFGGATVFSAALPNVQGSTAGAYIGKNGSAVGVELADGTNTIRIENDGTGLLRILKAGVQSNFEMTASGNTKIRGGLGVFNTAALTVKPTVTGSRADGTALANLLVALASYGLITDSTTA